MKHKWLWLSVAVFLSIQARTYYTVATDSDDFIQARLSKPLALLRSGCFTEGSDRPVDRRPECRVPDPFDSMTGNGCLLRAAYPMYSCRIGGVPLTLVGRPRHGGAQELPITLLSKALGPTRAVQVAIGVTKLAVVFLLYWGILLFRLPVQLLPFFVVSPVFHMLLQHSFTSTLILFLLYLAFCLVVSESRRKFFGGIATVAAGAYIDASVAVAMVPAIAVLAFDRKTRPRAVQLTVAIGACLVVWGAISLAFPLLRRELLMDLAEKTAWVRSPHEYWTYLTAFYDSFTLYDRVAEYMVLPEAQAPAIFSMNSLLRLAGFGLFLMLVLSGFVLKEKGSKTVRALIALFVGSGVFYLSVGHYMVPRILIYLPIAWTAVYLSAESVGRWLKKQRRVKLSRLPMTWLWVTALLSCGRFVYTFNVADIPIHFNADYHVSLGRRLIELGIRAPFVFNRPWDVGMLDVFSGETVRPVYVNLSDPLPASNLVERVLAPWPRLSAGTLLQRSVENMDGTTVPIGLPELERFAREHAIEIKRAEFFPSRGSEGHWIVDFVNQRWARNGPKR